MGIVGQECPTYGPIEYISFESFCCLLWVLCNVNCRLATKVDGGKPAANMVLPPVFFKNLGDRLAKAGRPGHATRYSIAE